MKLELLGVHPAPLLRVQLVLPGVDAVHTRVAGLIQVQTGLILQRAAVGAWLDLAGVGGQEEQTAAFRDRQLHPAGLVGRRAYLLLRVVEVDGVQPAKDVRVLLGPRNSIGHFLQPGSRS